MSASFEERELGLEYAAGDGLDWENAGVDGVVICANAHPRDDDGDVAGMGIRFLWLMA
jgi:hypothetical protein